MNPLPAIIGVGIVFWLCWATVDVYRICGIITVPWLLLVSPAIFVALFLGCMLLRWWGEYRRQRRQGLLIRRVILEGKLCVLRTREQSSLCVRTPARRGQVVHVDFADPTRTPFRDRRLS